MDDASGHGGHGDGHRAEPTSDLGRAMRDVLAVAPQFVATLQAKPDDHHGKHDHDEHEEKDYLGAPLTKLIGEIQAGLKGDMRNPAGLIADCKDALSALVKKFEGLKPSGHGHGHGADARPHNHLVAAILLALGVLAGAFLLFGGHTDAVFPAGSDPDYRQLAYAGAVDAPNLGTWMAWAVLLLAGAGALIWMWGRTPPPRQSLKQDNAKLRGLYEHGSISHDLYDRGRKLAPDGSGASFGASASEREPTPQYAMEFSRYILALADAYRHRRRMEAA